MGRHLAVHKRFGPTYHLSGGVRLDALFCLLAFLAYFLLPLPQFRQKSIGSNSAPIGLIEINLPCLGNPKAPPQPCHEPADCPICHEDQDSQDLIAITLVMGPVFSVFIQPVFTGGSRLKIIRVNLPVSGARAPPISL
jgi:hypothetical protein